MATIEEMSAALKNAHAAGDVKAATSIANALSSALPDDRAIDKDRGAGAKVRAAVAIARTPEDKLATIQKFYPDAKPYEGDNFVYTDPETNRPTLMNEQGWWPSIGDVAAQTPAAYEIGGGIIGGALAVPPAVVAAPATGGASFMAVPVGIGLGAAAGRELADITGKYAVGTVDTRGAGKKLTDAAVTGGVNTAGAKAGEYLAKGAGVAFGAAKRAIGGRSTAQVAREFDAVGAPLSVGSVTGNRANQLIETGVSNTPGGAATMQNTARGQADAASRYVDDLTGQMGGARTQQGAGESIQDATGKAVSRFETRQGDLYDDAFSKIGNTQTGLPETNRLYSQLINEQRAARGARDDVVNPVLNRVRKILAPKKVKTANGNQTVLQDINFDALRKVRTDVGRMLKSPLVGRVESAQQQYLNQLYGALSKDIEAAAQASGPSAQYALKLADRYTRFNLNTNIPLLEKITKLDAPEKAFDYAMSEARKGGSRLSKLRKNFTPDEWDTVAATVIDRLGQAVPSARGAAELGGDAAEFSASTFLTNWNKVSPEAKLSLFGGRRYADLRKSMGMLTRVLERVKDTQRMANSSGTARNIFVGALLATAGGKLLAGDVFGAAATVTGGTIAPYLTAKLMTNPRFVRWMTGAVNSTSRNPNTLPSVLARLGAIKKAEPEIAQEITNLQAAFQTGQAIPAQQ